MNNNLMYKIQVSNIYGELVDNTAPEPTIQFGVNGSNAKWGTDLQYGMCGMSERTFIKSIASITMSQICYNTSYISQIKAITERFPIFNTYRERIMKIDKTYAKIVANWICHFIDPSILNIATIQVMVVFMVYQFGYIDNLKAFVHYDFSKYNAVEIPDNNKFVYTEYPENAHFLDKRDIVDYNVDNWRIYIDTIVVPPIDSVMDLVHVVTSCCNRYYFEYGWHFHYQSFDLLTKCEIPEYPWNTYTIRKKLGLSNKDQTESHKQVTAKVSLLDIECIRTYMKMLCVRVPRHSSIYTFSNVHTIFNKFLSQCKSSNDVLTPYDMFAVTDKCLSTYKQIWYGVSYTDIMKDGMYVLHFVSTDVRDIRNRYVINYIHIIPLMRPHRLWPPYYDYSNVMNSVCSAILDPSGKFTNYKGLKTN